MQPGNQLVAAGYCMYGSSTQLVLTWGHGVHGFTLDPTIGAFILSHHNIRIPENPKTVRGGPCVLLLMWLNAVANIGGGRVCLSVDLLVQ